MSPKNAEVMLVDENDNQIGTEEKLRAHQNGAKLHRAISVFVFNKKGETMLQQRAMSKYHTPGRWSNTCCSHPIPGESVADAAHRRLREEMGFDCEMREAFSFIYKADVGNGLTENEYDHVLFGDYEGKPKINKEEVMSYRWMPLGKLREESERNPNDFTPWFRMVLDRVIVNYNSRKN
ncbi:MAG: isopentenyl-diphosphate Delta-isomerase [Candidatus Micrarchaeales archaeon]|jgi:isopentenyl-diphosphate delta-isomerase